MGENGNGPEVKPEVNPEEKKEQPVPEVLTPEKIKTLNGDVRANLCAAAINEVLKTFNCIFNPILKLDNQGHHIEVKTVGMAYEHIPTAVHPFMFNA